MGIGTTLQDARERRGLSLQQAEAVTKIRVRYLLALEEERWEALPDVAYVSGFLRAYAEFLGLDPEPLVAGLGERRSERRMLPEPIIRSGELPARKRSTRRLTLGAAVIVAGAGVVVALADGGAETESQDRRPSTEPELGRSAPPPAPTATPDRGPKQRELSLRLRATGDVWICLVDRRGRALVEAETLADSERRGPFEDRRFRLSAGNGQITLRANGRPLEVPSSSDPIGYEVRPQGLRPLAPPDRPTCS